MPRPKGSINKKKIEFREALRRYCDEKGIDPHRWMVDLLKRPGVTLDLKLQAAKEVCKYLEPQLKSVELKGDPDNPLYYVEQLSPEERRARMHALRAKLDAGTNGQAPFVVGQEHC